MIFLEQMFDKWQKIKVLANFVKKCNILQNFVIFLNLDNLITLCRYHHEMAEAGEIPREELQEIVAGK